MVKTTKIDPITFEFQTYETQDETLIPTSEVNTALGTFNYLEFYVYNLNRDILYSDLNYSQYRIENGGVDGINNIILNPTSDVTNNGFSEGEFIAYYNFFVNQIGNQNQDKLYISEISSDRTEIRLDTNRELSIVPLTNEFIQFRDQQDYFVDFYLNFGDNNLIIANNIKLDNETTNDPTIIVKLYEPLPNNFSLKDQLWIVTTLNEPEAFQVSYPIETIEFNDSTQLSGPNFNIPLKNQINNSSQNLSYNDIISGAPTSSQNQINNVLGESNIDISVDYTNFSNFIHFSSAQTRIENFYYKVGLIETITSNISTLQSISSSLPTQLIERKKIKNLIQNFDKFEHFMYYSSGSIMSYPKSTAEPPYTLMPISSAEVLTWLGSIDENSGNYGGLLLTSSNFDNANLDLLKKSIPEYLKEDPLNQQYDLFVDMVAQYYDNVWLYTKDITQKYNADNRLDFGVSKDLVADAIRDFGLKLYQNNFSNQELYTAFLGITPKGNLFPFPEITGSLPAPTGFEFVDTLISASNDVISMDNTNKSLYKRIYHNIPYLLKSKGTITGLRALITSYGIPDTILKISEFGGKDKVNANDYDLYSNNFNNAHLNVAENYISSSWQVNGRWSSNSNRPSTVQFRFKAEEFPPTNLSQSLFSLYNGPALISDLVLEYNGSGSLSGSYSASIQDPYYQYANLKWVPNTSAANNSASIYLPFLNNGWWSVMITSGSSNGFELHAANKIYDGNNGTSIGYTTSSAINSGTWSTLPTKAYFATSSTHEGFSGSLQEIRYYNTRISESIFKDYTMNPLSFEGNGVNSAPDQLIFRATLGSELDTSTTSIHPKVTGSYNVYTQSFSNHSNFYVNNNLNLKPNTETFFLDQPAVGIKNRITDKIRVENNSLPSGNTLSSINRLSQVTEASSSYTDSVNYLEVAFSPQNQINDDIIAQMGHFNIGDYIGDPRQRFSGSRYEDLNNLSEEYFKKYIKQYDLVDFVRLIKFFDNSLFKMIKDFIPARTSLASGLVVKQHLLERNKYPQPIIQPAINELLTGSLDIATISGGPAGIFNKFNSTTTSPSGSLGQGPNNIYNITQSWDVITPSINGFISKSHSSQDEFYNGELSGSNIIVTDGNLILSGSSGSESNPLLNNVDQYPTNNFLQDIDYSSNPITPVNVNRIISGTADKGTTPESYYTSLKHTRLRYEGSKIQSSDFNVYDDDAGTSSFGNPINIGTYGQTPVIDSLDNTIVEFNWAGGTNPEIPFGGSFKLSNMLFEVNNPDDIKIIVPGTNIREFSHDVLWASGSGNINQLVTGSTTTIEERDDYYEILNSSYGAGKSLVPFEYNPDGQPILPLFTKVIESTIEVPARSTFALSSSYNGNLGDWINNSGYIQIDPSASLARLGENYSTSNNVDLLNPDNFQNLITDDIKKGNRYFITIFNSLDFPISVTEEDQVFKYETVADKPDATELQKKGVFEIEGVFLFTTTNKLLLKMKRQNFSGSDIYFGNGNKGFLIWKSPTAYKRQALIVDQRTSGVGPGGFYSLNTTDTVRDNFESITKEYGSNQTG